MTSATDTGPAFHSECWVGCVWRTVFMMQDAGADSDADTSASCNVTDSLAAAVLKH